LWLVALHAFIQYSPLLKRAESGHRRGNNEAVWAGPAAKLIPNGENLTIATGLPMPKVYVITIPAPNAATGRDPNHAIIKATSGSLDMMDDK